MGNIVVPCFFWLTVYIKHGKVSVTYVCNGGRGQLISEWRQWEWRHNTRRGDDGVRHANDVTMTIAGLRRYWRQVAPLYRIISFGQWSSLLWTHTLRPFDSRPIALTQEGRSLVNHVCECVRDWRVRRGEKAWAACQVFIACPCPF